MLPSRQSNVGFTGNAFKINIEGRKIKKSAHISSNVTEVVDTLFLQFPREGIVPVMANTERLRPKGVAFSGFRYINLKR